MRKIILSILLLLFFASTTFSAELGAGKALKADKGPSLEQTTDFIKSKLKDFFADYYGEDPYSTGQPYYVSQELRFITFDSCNMKIMIISQGYGRHLEINLSEVASVAPELSEILGIDMKPLYAIVLKENAKNMIDTQRDFKKGENTIVKYDYFQILVKNKEYATRMSNAFERAVQLCGGGKDIGKEELF